MAEIYWLRIYSFKTFFPVSLFTFFPTSVFLKLLSFQWFNFKKLLIHILSFHFPFFYIYRFCFIPGSNCLICFNFEFYFSIYLVTFDFSNIVVLFFSYSFLSFFHWIFHCCIYLLLFGLFFLTFLLFFHHILSFSSSSSFFIFSSYFLFFLFILSIIFLFSLSL